MTELELGKRIQRLRKQSGLSQLDMATLCEMQSGHLANIEHGKRSPTFATLNKIADGFGISVSELVADAEPTLQATDETMNMVIAQVKQMTPSARRELVQVIKHIKRLVEHQ